MSWNIEGREVDISSVRRPFSNIHEKVIHIDRGRRHLSLARSLPSAKTSLGLAKHRQVGEGEGRAACWQVAKELLEAEGNYHTVNSPSSSLFWRSRGFVLRMSGGCQFRPGRACDAWEDEGHGRARGGPSINDVLTLAKLDVNRESMSPWRSLVKTVRVPIAPMKNSTGANWT